MKGSETIGARNPRVEKLLITFRAATCGAAKLAVRGARVSVVDSGRSRK